MIKNLYKNVLTLLIASMSLQVSLFANDINIDVIAKNPQHSQKHLLIFIHTTDCGYCESMIEFTFDNELNAQHIKNNFVFIDINVKEAGVITYKDFKGSKKDFSIYLGRNIYPSTVFIDTSNTKVFAQSGYEDEENYLPILEYVHTKSYKNNSIEDFVNMQDFKKRL